VVQSELREARATEAELAARLATAADEGGTLERALAQTRRDLSAAMQRAERAGLAAGVPTPRRCAQLARPTDALN
jgi:hypothetical protein